MTEVPHPAPRPLLFSASPDVGCYSDMEAGHQIRKSLEKTECWDVSLLQKAISFNLCLNDSMDREWSRECSKAWDLKHSLLSQHYSRIRKGQGRATGMRRVLLQAPKPRKGQTELPRKTSQESKNTADFEANT